MENPSHNNQLLSVNWFWQFNYTIGNRLFPKILSDKEVCHVSQNCINIGCMEFCTWLNGL